MPSFSSSSSIRVTSQDHTLRLKITHNFLHGSPSDAMHSVKGRLPKELDVLWLSDIIISFSGSLDGHKFPSHDLARSGLVHHFRTQLKANADRLGLNNVSRPFVDDTDGLSKLTLTPSRPLPPVSRPHTNLVSLHLAYIWMTVAPINEDTVDSGHLVERANPFASNLFLPAEALLNRVTEQFLIYHLVGRYPLIFGPWCKRLDLETQYFPSISHSIVEIMTRSKNQGFVLKCRRLLKAARTQHQFVLEASAAALSSCTENASDTPQEEIDHAPAPPVLMDGQVLCESLEQLFRVGTPKRRFKPAATPQLAFLSQDDEDGLLESIPDERIDSEVSWIELPGIATSPCALLGDRDQMLLEDMDVFTQEEWPDDGMWHLLEADANAVDGLPATSEPQSEGSLIDTAASLASITTRSPQASTLTLYHHQDVTEPAANGSHYDDLQFAYLEDPGTWGPSPLYAPHDRHCPEKSEQVMQNLRACQVDSESIESIDSSFEDAEIEDSDSILLDLDIAEFADMEGNLDWLV